MGFALDELRVVRSFEEVASALVRQLKRCAYQPLSARIPRAMFGSGVSIRKMEVVSHQAIGEALPLEPHNGAA